MPVTKMRMMLSAFAVLSHVLFVAAGYGDGNGDVPITGSCLDWTDCADGMCDAEICSVAAHPCSTSSDCGHSSYTCTTIETGYSGCAYNKMDGEYCYDDWWCSGRHSTCQSSTCESSSTSSSSSSYSSSYSSSSSSSSSPSSYSYSYSGGYGVARYWYYIVIGVLAFIFSCVGVFCRMRKKARQDAVVQVVQQPIAPTIQPMVQPMQPMQMYPQGPYPQGPYPQGPLNAVPMSGTQPNSGGPPPYDYPTATPLNG